jgi:hypothetical protein
LPQRVRGIEINAVAVVDDDDEARTGYSYPLEDLHLTPLPAAGPLPPLGEFWLAIAARCDAVLCDHHLKKSDYADFNGAEAVATWYDAGFPAVLCTKWESAQIDEIRPFRSRIPALIQPDQLASDPEIFLRALDSCLVELAGEFRPDRRPWRAQVYVVEVEPDAEGQFVYVELPGWQVDEVVRLRKQDIPADIRDQLAPEFRCYAGINLGAESTDELYFRDWEQ